MVATLSSQSSRERPSNRPSNETRRREPIAFKDLALRYVAALRERQVWTALGYPDEGLDLFSAHQSVYRRILAKNPAAQARFEAMVAEDTNERRQVSQMELISRAVSGQMQGLRITDPENAFIPDPIKKKKA